MLLASLSKKPTRKIIGLMSGTSADSIDAVLVEVKGTGPGMVVKCRGFHKAPYPEDVRLGIFELFSPRTGTVDKICRMNFLLGELFAEAALALCQRLGIEIQEIDLIASHGQTIHHLPPHSDVRRVQGSTLQIGEAAIIAERTGVLTVADFHPADMAVGGQGAPLVAYADYVLFSDKTKSRAIVNIGGIANVTMIPAGAREDDIIAFDTGPGNMVIDGIVRHITHGKQQYDIDGQIAAQGTVDEVLLSELLSHPFFNRKPPKTTGREEFGEDFVLSVIQGGRDKSIAHEDLVATVTALTAASIAKSLIESIPHDLMPEEVILSGGGSHNPVLVGMLKSRLARCKILRVEDFGILSEAKEGIAFAILANETIFGKPSNLPAATGATRKVILGKIILPGSVRRD